MGCPYVAIPVEHGLSHTVYECYIHSKCTDYRLRLVGGDGGKISGLEMDWELNGLMSRHSGIIQQMLSQNISALSFLQDFSNFVLSVVEEETGDRQQPGSPVFTLPHILAQMEAVGWDKLESMDPAFQHMKLKLCDAKGRPHILHVSLAQQSSDVNALCTVDLPITADFHVKPHKQVDIQQLLDQFREMLRRCEDFWDMLAEIDDNTWVLEPEKPGPSDCHRRIAIDTNASLQIKVDANHPRMLPECRFLGADQKITPLKEKLNNNLHKWNVETSLLENLHTVLDITFPSPANSSKQQFSVECGICYSYSMDNQIPDKVCDNQHCGQAFHQECLYEWLRTLPSSRQSFNTIFGECPFCNKPMTVKMSTS